jgi:hypothetical protein
MAAVQERPRHGPRTRTPLFPFVLAAFLMTGCQVDRAMGSSLDIAGGGLTGIDLRGDSLVMLGNITRMQATGSVGGLLGMFSYDLLNDARWSTADASVATVTPDAPVAGEPAAATVRGISLGTTYITVSARGFSATQRVRVVDIWP